MLIGELAKLTGFSKDTIRYYEKIGLLNNKKRNRSENNYRNYSEFTVSKLHMIKKIKALGFTLNEIKDFFLYDQHNMIDCDSLNAVIHQKIKQIEVKLAELNLIKQKLEILQTECDGYCKEMIKKI